MLPITGLFRVGKPSLFCTIFSSPPFNIFSLLLLFSCFCFMILVSNLSKLTIPCLIIISVINLSTCLSFGKTFVHFHSSLFHFPDMIVSTNVPRIEVSTFQFWGTAFQADPVRVSMIFVLMQNTSKTIISSYFPKTESRNFKNEKCDIKRE